MGSFPKRGYNYLSFISHDLTLNQDWGFVLSLQSSMDRMYIGDV